MSSIDQAQGSLTIGVSWRDQEGEIAQRVKFCGEGVGSVIVRTNGVKTYEFGLGVQQTREVQHYAHALQMWAYGRGFDVRSGRLPPGTTMNDVARLLGPQAMADPVTLQCLRMFAESLRNYSCDNARGFVFRTDVREGSATMPPASLLLLAFVVATGHPLYVIL